MGFGHPVYKTYDPRSAMLRRIARQIGGPLVDFAQQVEATALTTLAELKPDQQIHTNVEFYAGVVMELPACHAHCSPRHSRRPVPSAGARTSSSRRPTTASFGPARGTSDRPHRNHYR
jgi:hypothetical protein